VPHQHTAYNGLEKPALRMLNGFLTFHYGALNSSCYYGDSAPGGGLLGIVLMERTHICGPRCRGSPRGWARGVSGPSFVPVDWVEVVAHLMAARRSSREKGDGLSKARRLRLLVGTFVLALSVMLTGCNGSGTQERKEDYEKMKMLKKQEEKEKKKGK
jgi:hypothetical protein